ncbi:hypothetical protein [Levilactobacillus yiduensis]|uniref:hypothetical protein n=1 Tax=Levilactobacillus yiduensis TaxID=2953880 RepID=UPI000EF29D0A|nr:hypothetical protein [Levilactobacillus yiduensis]AYM01979.1 hypothetical protein D8911_02835 [Levilactobacillus brevis]
MKNPNFDPIVRHQTSRTSRILRAVVLIALWLFIALVVFANISFSLGWYSDGLVSLYLLLNLQPHANNAILLLIGVLLLIVPVYCGWRWTRLTKEDHA